MQQKRMLLTVMLAVIVLGGAGIFWLAPQFAARLGGPEAQTEESEYMGYPAKTAKAKVLQIMEEGMVTDDDHPRPYQIFLVHVLEGPYQGEKIIMDFGVYQAYSAGVKIQAGDVILVNISQRVDTGEVTAHFLDFERSRPLFWLFATFVFFSILIGGWKGLRGLVGILFSLVVIILFIIPQILAGKDPVLVSVAGSFFFLAISMYLVYGWTVKTHAAVLGILIALLITGTLSVFFVSFTRLTGLGDESTMFLASQVGVGFDMRGLLLAGMLIGSLGVLDDLVISQASAVFELHSANNSLKLPFLYRRAMNIGRDHVASTVNTLVLAYAGASLPMLLLFSLNNSNYGMLVNMSVVAEEIVRSLVGSIGLFTSVPITTFLTCLLVLHHERLGWLRPFLGPLANWEAHEGHIH